MASPFDSLTLPQLQQRLQAAHGADGTRSALATSESALRAGAVSGDAENDQFYAGDHWQQGRGWVGPQPPIGDGESAAILAEIARAFVSKNVVREVVNRHRDGVVGREPAWGVTPRRPLKLGQKPTQKEQAQIDAATAALTTWWDARAGLTRVQQLTVQLLLHGRASLRVFVPAGLLAMTADGRPTVPPAADLGAALDRIYLDVPHAAQAGRIVDDATQQQAGVYVYQTADGATRAELSYVDPATGETVLRVLGDSTVQETRLPLDGHLLLHAVTRAALVSPQIRQIQKQLNLAKTMEGRNAVQGGFLERTVLNAQMPGVWVDDPQGTLQADGTRKTFRPGVLRLGAGRTNWISGQPIRDAQNRITGYTDPSVIYRDPVSPATFEMTADAAYRAILEEAQQLHALIAGDATASGESRKQARADFATSLWQTKTEVDALVRWLLETVLALAAVFAGQAGQYAALRATCDCRIDTGPLSGDEQQQILDQVDAEVLSRETAMSRLGVEDVDAERQRIATERAARQAAAAQHPSPAGTAPTSDSRGTAPGTAPAQQAQGDT